MRGALQHLSTPFRNLLYFLNLTFSLVLWLLTLFKILPTTPPCTYFSPNLTSSVLCDIIISVGATTSAVLIALLLAHLLESLNPKTEASIFFVLAGVWTGITIAEILLVTPMVWTTREEIKTAVGVGALMVVGFLGSGIVALGARKKTTDRGVMVDLRSEGGKEGDARSESTW